MGVLLLLVLRVMVISVVMVSDVEVVWEPVLILQLGDWRLKWMIDQGEC